MTWAGPAKEFFADPSLCSDLGSTITESKLLRGLPTETDKHVGDEFQKESSECTFGGHPTLLFEDEERVVGGVQFHVLKFYAQLVGGIWGAVALCFGVILSAASKIMDSYWFIWWIRNEFQVEKSVYMGGYLGIALTQTAIQGKMDSRNI